MTVLISIILIFTVIFIYLLLPGGNLRRQYMDDVQQSFGELTGKKHNVLFTEEGMVDLPNPMKRFFSHCGYISTPMMEYMHLDMKDARLALSREQKPMKVHYEQYNFVARPDRHAFIDARLIGTHLISGKDTLTDGEGSMTIRVAKLLQIAKTTGHEMSQSQFITTLADAVFMPSFYLQDYLAWTPIDDTHTECTITWGDLTASGTFTFNEAGEIVRFDTNDRYQDNNGMSVNLPWSVEYGDYREVNGFLLPGLVRIYWHMPDGSKFLYFESDDYTVSYS